MNREAPAILVLDDNRDAADALAAVLKRERYTVRTAYSVREALDALDDDASIAAVFSDVRMPDVDGFDFLRVVRLRHPSLPVILVTGQPIDDEDIVPRGAVLLIKPVVIPRLVEALASIEAFGR